MLKISFNFVLDSIKINNTIVLNMLLFFFFIKNNKKIEVINKICRNNKLTLIRAPFHYKTSKKILEKKETMFEINLYLNNNNKCAVSLRKKKLVLFNGIFLYKTIFKKNIKI